MLVSVKDSIKFIGVTVVCFCAVFVCTFFLNYYLDIVPLEADISEDVMPLYKAQLATAQMTCGITGGFLSVIAVIMLLFYIKLYIDAHGKEIGTFKAMGYSDSEIAGSFTVFGLGAFIGCALGFGIGWTFMPTIYNQLAIDGLPEITVRFHPSLLFALVVAPAVVFTVLAYVYGIIILRKPALAIMRGTPTKTKKVKHKTDAKNRPFLKEFCLSALGSKKTLVFWITFSCFCFSAMVQMGLSMENLASGTMAVMILIIGLVLAFISMFMAMTSLVKENAKNVAVMKAMGFSVRERFVAVFVGYIPFAVLGFAIGTVYQFGLLQLMINVIFNAVGEIPAYTFDVPVFFYTLLMFAVAYSAVFAVYLIKTNRIPVKMIMTEN